MVFAPLLAVTLLTVSPAVGYSTPSLEGIVGDFTAACREGTESSEVVDEIRNGMMDLEDILTELQSQGKPAAEECPYGWNHIGDNCFLIPMVKSNWYRAQYSCTMMDPRAELASVLPSNSQQLRELVMASTSSSYGAWIGLVRLGSSDDFGWTDSSPMVFTDWNKGEPSGDGNCVHIWGPGHNAQGWNDLSCHTNDAYALCQIKLK